MRMVDATDCITDDSHTQFIPTDGSPSKDANKNRMRSIMNFGSVSRHSKSVFRPMGGVGSGHDSLMSGSRMGNNTCMSMSQ